MTVAVSFLAVLVLGLAYAVLVLAWRVHRLTLQMALLDQDVISLLRELRS
jgi:hypothetical protein